MADSKTTDLSPAMERFLHGKHEKLDEDGHAIQRRWRVDVAGVPVSVYGEEAMRHLQQVNQQLARMKLALHKLKWVEGSVGETAKMGLKND